MIEITRAADIGLKVFLLSRRKAPNVQTPVIAIMWYAFAPTDAQIPQMLEIMQSPVMNVRIEPSI